MKRRWAGLLATLALVGSVAALAPGRSAAATGIPYTEISDSQSAALATRLPAGGVRQAVLAFIVAHGGACNPGWDGAAAVSRRPFAGQIASLRNRGVDLTLSFGGQSGRELALACRTPRALAAAYAAAANAYGIHKLDFDLEQQGLARSAITRRAQALRLLQQQSPATQISLTLPVSTHGLDASALRPVRAALQSGVRLSAVNLMAMDFGRADAPRPRGRMAVYVEQSATAAHAQLARLGLGWPKLAITVMVGQNDTPGEFVGTADARRVAAFARAHGVAQVRYWSANRDPKFAYAHALAMS